MAANADALKQRVEEFKALVPLVQASAAVSSAFIASGMIVMHAGTSPLTCQVGVLVAGTPPCKGTILLQSSSDQLSPSILRAVQLRFIGVHAPHWC
jgi:hypothetical protein